MNQTFDVLLLFVFFLEFFFFLAIDSLCPNSIKQQLNTQLWTIWSCYWRINLQPRINNILLGVYRFLNKQLLLKLFCFVQGRENLQLILWHGLLKSTKLDTWRVLDELRIKRPNGLFRFCKSHLQNLTR